MWTNDCAFYRNGLQPDCIALKELDCRKCVFHKTKDELTKERKKAIELLKKKGLDGQILIEKYDSNKFIDELEAL